MQKTIYIIILCLCAAFPNFLHAQWTKTNGLPGGSVHALLQYGDSVLAEVGDELYFSSNHGQAWSFLTHLNNISFFRSITDGQTIVANRYDPSTGYRMIRSNDFGQNWQYIASADTMQFHETFLAFGYLYASDQHGLYRTNDDGASWEYTTPRQISNIQFDGQRITGSSYPHILQSSDGGFTWDTLLQVSGNVIDMLQHENHLFAFMQNAQQGCYASSDFGQTWQQYTGTAFDQYYDFIWHNGSIYGLKGNEILKSSNSGQTWASIPAPVNSYYPAYAGVSTGNVIIIGGFFDSGLGNILRSTDEGDSWFAADSGIMSASGKLRVVNNQLYAPDESGLFQLDADGVNWTRKTLNFTPPQIGGRGITDFVASSDNLVLSRDYYNPQVSLDGGITWNESLVASSNWTDGIQALETVGNKVIGLGNNFDFTEYYISDNNGLTFLPLQSLNNQHQTSISILDVDQEKVYALAYNKKIYRSNDGCDSWVLQTDQLPVDSFGFWGSYGTRFIVRGNVMAIIADHYVKKMAYSKDAGQTWTLIDLTTAGFPFGEATFNDLLYIGNNLIAATDNGMFRSVNDGTDWIDWNDGLENRAVNNLEVHDGFLWAATSGSGIWKRSLIDLGMKPVAGKVFLDENNNSIQDPGETNLSNVVVQSLSTNGYTNTRLDGSFELFSDLVQEQIKVHPPKPYWVSTPDTRMVDVPSTGADFALSLPSNAKDLSVDLTNISVLRPGFETDYLLHWNNNVPLTATDVSLSLSYPIDLLDLIESIPMPSTQTGGTLTWELGDVAAEAFGNILLRFKVPVSDSLGTKICISAEISPQTADLIATDNIDENCSIVVGSYDPNDKQAEPSGFLNPTQLANNEPITYTIRFQNTGNYPATFVRITDTIQQSFDPASFQFLSASAPCSWNLRGQGVVEFFFDNIQLPPITTDEPGSHGFVKYSVRPRQNLPLGTPLRNTAHIFFDFNAPIVTNTTETLAGLVRTHELSDQTLSLQLFPNPASQLVRVETGESMGELILQDAMGRVVFQKSIQEFSTAFSVDTLPQGVYQVLFVGAQRTQYGSLVIQR